MHVGDVVAIRESDRKHDLSHCHAPHWLRGVRYTLFRVPTSEIFCEHCVVFVCLGNKVCNSNSLKKRFMIETIKESENRI